MGQNSDFWTAAETLVAQSRIVIDRPKGSAHPRYPDFLYPVDYGYLEMGWCIRILTKACM